MNSTLGSGMFICASCRVRIASGLEGWENCETCIRVREALKDAPPYQPPDPPYQPPPLPEPTPEQLEASKQARKRAAEHNDKLAKERAAENAEIDKWWDNFASIHKPGYEGIGDPELPFECFNDFTLSPMLRAKMREQLSIEHDNMPELAELLSLYSRE